MSTAQSTLEEKDLADRDTGTPEADHADHGRDSQGAGQDGPWSRVAQAMEDAASSLQAAIGGGSPGAQPASGSGVMARVVYRTSYTVSYGVVFPVALIAGLVPKENPVTYGLIDGGRAALDAIEKWHTAPKTDAPAPVDQPSPAANPA